METILIVDDEKNYLLVLEALLGPQGYEIITVNNAHDALRLVREADLDLVITDVKMPGMNGMELLEESKKIKPELPVIIMTAYGSIEMAVEAMKKNAYDYITKPFQNEQLKLTVKKALDNYRLIKQNKLLSQALSDRFRYGNMVGKSKPILKIYDIIEKVAQSKASVLITGPSGTGKELIAKAIHYGGSRRDRPFVSINCGALTETLLESELFGHERGAFTGAVRDRTGRFKEADGGTIFLDEIGDISPFIQVKLLRVLQEREIERVGESKKHKIDIRIIAATNKNLYGLVNDGNFREDLYYRLKVFPINIPPLRKRKEDIPLLIDNFINIQNKKTSKRINNVSQSALRILMDYTWPGNVRELENAIEHAFVLCIDKEIDIFDLPVEIRQFEYQAVAHITPRSTQNSTSSRRQVTREILLDILHVCDWNKAEAGRRMGLSRTAVWKYMKKWDIPLKPPSN